MADPSDLVPIPPLASAMFRHDGQWLTAELWGELDLSSTPGIVGALDAAVAAGDRRVCVDLRRVTFCDSSGLAMLYRFRQRSMDEGLDFVIANPTGSVRRIIELCDQSGALPIVDDDIAPAACAD